MTAITCHCETSFEVDFPELIDIDAQPATLAEILSGAFFAVSCPECGQLLKPELRVRLLSAKRRLDLLALPEAERFAFYRGSVDLAAVTELVIGFAELYERALILDADLDAAAIEILKYHIFAKASLTAGSEDGLAVAFAGGDAEGRLAFRIEGLRKGDVALLALPLDRYAKALSELPRLAMEEPFSQMLAGPYRSLRALEMGET